MNVEDKLSTGRGKQIHCTKSSILQLFRCHFIHPQNFTESLNCHRFDYFYFISFTVAAKAVFCFYFARASTLIMHAFRRKEYPIDVFIFEMIVFMQIFQVIVSISMIYVSDFIYSFPSILWHSDFKVIILFKRVLRNLSKPLLMFCINASLHPAKRMNEKEKHGETEPASASAKLVKNSNYSFRNLST